MRAARALARSNEMPAPGAGALFTDIQVVAAAKAATASEEATRRALLTRGVYPPGGCARSIFRLPLRQRSGRIAINAMRDARQKETRNLFVSPVDGIGMQSSRVWPLSIVASACAAIPPESWRGFGGHVRARRPASEMRLELNV